MLDDLFTFHDSLAFLVTVDLHSYLFLCVITVLKWPRADRKKSNLSSTEAADVLFNINDFSEFGDSSPDTDALKSGKDSSGSNNNDGSQHHQYLFTLVLLAIDLHLR